MESFFFGYKYVIWVENEPDTSSHRYVMVLSMERVGMESVRVCECEGRE